MRKRFKLHITVDGNTIDKNNKLAGNAIIWEELDSMHLFRKNSYNIRIEDLEGLGFPGLDRDNIDLQDKTLYRYPKLSLPRDKVDLIKEKYNCKVIRDPSKADIHITSVNYFDTIFKKEWTSSISFSQTYKLLKYMKEVKDILSESALDTLRDFMTHAPKDAMVIFNVYRPWQSSSAVEKAIYDDIHEFLYDQTDYSRSNSDWILQSEHYTAFNNFKTSKAQIVLDVDIADIIDQDLAVITNDKYDDIEAMINSNDIDNRSLALEMLSNCNINKSYDVVSGLYFWNYDALKSTTNWNSVNARAFKKRLSKFEGVHSKHSIHSYNQYLLRLSEQDMLSEFAVNNTRKQLHNICLSEMVGPTSNVFKVDLKSIYINEELTNQIIKDE